MQKMYLLQLEMMVEDAVGEEGEARIEVGVEVGIEAVDLAETKGKINDELFLRYVASIFLLSHLLYLFISFPDLAYGIKNGQDRFT